jgi:hypothetical protein
MKTKRRFNLGTTRIEPRMAPPKYTERRRSKPGTGNKRARGVMAPRPSR